MAVVFIGAAGEMCRVAIERFAAVSDAKLVLADINTTALETLAAKLPAGRATIRKIDLFDRAVLASAVKGAALVVLGAGPYQKTSSPVLSACLEAKVPYLDFDDDVESTQDAMGLHERAQKEGVACYIGCGASPGMSNVMAIDAARGLDTVDELHLCWLVGDERPGIGKAVLEHLMHISAGPCLTWSAGKPTINETWAETAYMPMLEQRGETLLHETAHPEPVTLPRLFPNAQRIRCLGGLDPAPFNGIARGLGKAVRSGALPIDEAVGFMYSLVNEPPSAAGWKEGLGQMMQHFRGGDVTVNELLQIAGHAVQAVSPWRHALMGMAEQIWSGECSAVEVLGFLVSSARGKTVENKGALLVKAIGRRNGHPAVVVKRTGKSGKDCHLFKDMASATGTACAAFILMALEAGQSRKGVFNPEDWAEPQLFYKTLSRLGTPQDEMVQTVSS